MTSPSQIHSRPRSKSRGGRRSSSSNTSHIPSTPSNSRPSSHHRNGTDKKRSAPLIDMNSIQPFSAPATPTTTGGASKAFTRTTAATAATSGSSSEESRGGARRVRSGSRRRERAENSSTRRRSGPDHSRTVVSSSSSSSVGRRRRPETSPGESRRSATASSRVESRGRSCSRPRSVGRSASIARKSEQHRRPLVLEEPTTRGRSLSRPRREAERGRSLDPLGSAASTCSMSRGRRPADVTRTRGHSIGPSSSLRTSARSRSHSRARPSHLRTAKRASMETMEEERDEDISERHLVYDRASSRDRAAKNATRSASRRSLSRNPRRGSSESGHAAAAAIAAALHQVKKSQLGHDGNRRPPKDATLLGRKASRSVSPLHHKSRSRSIFSLSNQLRRKQSSSFHLPSPSHEERNNVRSFHSSSSSSFSSYDRKIAKNYQNNPGSTNVRPSSSSSSSTISCRRNSTSKQQQPQAQPPQHKSSSEMAICPMNDKNPTSSAAVEAAFQPLLDDDGCCIFHPFIQIKMKLPSGAWRILSRHCVVCREEEKTGGDTIVLSSSRIKSRRRNEGDRSSSVVAATPVANGDSGECSLTPSVLEDNDDTNIASAEECGSKRGDDATTMSSRGSVNSLIEHKKIKTSKESAVHSIPSGHLNGGKAELSPHDTSVPSRLGSFDEESVKSKHSVDGSTVKESVASRHSVHAGIEQDDAKSTATAATRKHHEKKSTKPQPSVDMSLVESVIESALQKIKSMDEIHQKNAGETAPPSTRSHPPPPPPPRSQSSKNLPSKAPSRSMHPPPSGNPSVSSSNSSSLQRPPPPPPPPRPPAKTNSVPSSMDSRTPPATKTPPPPDALDYDCSMKVLNPEPEPELQNDDFPLEDFDEMAPPFEQMEVSGMMGLAKGFPTTALSATVTTANVSTPPADWMKYCISASAREGRDVNQKGERKSRLFGRNSAKHDNNERGVIRSVKQMPFTDQFGDFGLYTGQVNEDGRPDGKGSMKYDNGVFYEGTWTNGGQDQKAALQYERIRGGFTSWQGKGKQATKSGMVLPWNARKNDSHNANEKTNVRGMEWTDLNGDSGRYTGEVNADELPHGHGIMKYDFGLIAEGEWNNGVLKENPQDRLIASAAIGSARSIGPGMSVGPGAHGFSAAASIMGGMSVGGPASVFTGPPIYPMPYGGMNSMMMAAPAHPVSQFAMMAHQNAMMKGQMSMYGGGSVYGGASAYGGGSAYGTSTYGQTAEVQGAQPASHNTPPISEIKIS